MDPKKLKQLTEKWRKKLEKSGFRDIEYPNGHLRRFDSFYFQMEYSPVAFKAREIYFRLAGRLLHTHRFATRRQRQMWELHCQGYTMPAIAKRMKVSKQRVSEVLSAIALHLPKSGIE